MAVLKFRAWHKAAKKFYECYGVDLSKKGHCYIQHPDKPNQVVAVKQHEFEVTQSTGLQDSFGVEIFEGDWVLTYEDSESPYLVIWDAKKGYWGLIDDILAPGCLIAGHSERFKVVGNLYQNPEFQQKFIGQ